MFFIQNICIFGKNVLSLQRKTKKAILHDPERRAVWQARYDEAKQMAKKHGKRIQGRLCDYVRHEVSKALKNGEEIV